MWYIDPGTALENYQERALYVKSISFHNSNLLGFRGVYLNVKV